VIVVLPLWLVFHYVTKWRSARALTDEHEHVLAQLWESAARMEARIAVLEKLLDVEAPGWRTRS
jgi:phage shock protein B